MIGKGSHQSRPEGVIPLSYYGLSPLTVGRQGRRKTRQLKTSTLLAGQLLWLKNAWLSRNWLIVAIWDGAQGDIGGKHLVISISTESEQDLASGGVRNSAQPCRLLHCFWVPCIDTEHSTLYVRIKILGGRVNLLSWGYPEYHLHIMSIDQYNSNTLYRVYKNKIVQEDSSVAFPQAFSNPSGPSPLATEEPPRSTILGLSKPDSETDPPVVGAGCAVGGRDGTVSWGASGRGIDDSRSKLVL